MKRRDFLRNTVAGAAGGLAASTLPRRRVMAATGTLGLNEKARVGFIGTGHRAVYHMTKENLPDYGVIVAVADCYLTRMEEAAKATPGSGRWNRYQDYRDLLDKEKLDLG